MNSGLLAPVFWVWLLAGVAPCGSMCVRVCGLCCDGPRPAAAVHGVLPAAVAHRHVFIAMRGTGLWVAGWRPVSSSLQDSVCAAVAARRWAAVAAPSLLRLLPPLGCSLLPFWLGLARMCFDGWLGRPLCTAALSDHVAPLVVLTQVLTAAGHAGQRHACLPPTRRKACCKAQQARSHAHS